MDTQADIRVEERDGRGRYVMAMPDGDEAYLTYARRDAGTIVIDYSFVPPQFRGRGVAAILILCVFPQIATWLPSRTRARRRAGSCPPAAMSRPSSAATRPGRTCWDRTR